MSYIFNSNPGVPRNPRYRSLDFWRGVACLMVVVYHASFYAQANLAGTDFVAGLTYKLISYMWIGVPIFFAISGYCITASSDSARRKPRAVQQYFWRRFRRI